MRQTGLLNMSSSETASDPGRVMIVSSSVGSGHNAAAAAIQLGLQQADPRIAIESIDVLDYTPWVFRAYYAGGFALGMSKFPRVYGLGFHLTNHPWGPARGLAERGRILLERLAMRRFGEHLLASRPDVVLCTHFLASPLVGRLIRDGKLDAKLLVAVTDDCVHRFWYAANVDHWFVPAQCSAASLQNCGIEPQRITVSGIAIHAKWTQPADRQRVLADWSLPADRKIVLLSGGTDFTCGPIVRIARAIVDTCPKACVVVLAGRNKKLLARLSKLDQTPERIRPMGFTDRLNELVEVCSLMVTKAGGIITAECLAKAAPMVFLRPVPGHEAGNARYFQSEGAAVITRNVGDVARTVARLLDRPEELARLSENARRLYRPGTATICKAICGAMDCAESDLAASLPVGKS